MCNFACDISISFDDPFQYSNDDYFTLIGIYKSDFDNICEQARMRGTNIGFKI